MLTVAFDIEALARSGRALADPIRCRPLLAIPRDRGLVPTVPDGRRERYDRTCADAGEKGCR